MTNTHHHPALLDLHSDWRHGRMSRREFLRTAMLLGASATAAHWLTGCQPTVSTPAPHVIKRGGILRVGLTVREMIDQPARLSWLEQANITRHIAEYLTETDASNLTHPLLLERWTVSEDVKTWTLFVRQGVTFNDGSMLTADDVIFNLQQWLDPQLGSSMRTLLTELSPNDIERVDDYTVRLHLSRPQIAVPEYLFHYPAQIVPRTFEGDFVRQPIGTGPFTLSEYAEGQKVVLKRRKDYWRIGEDGQPYPYLDELHYLDMDGPTRVAAMQAGELDTLFSPNSDDWQALQNVPQINIYSVNTAQTLVARMRTDIEPWRDVRVRQALRLCQDRDKILQASFFGEGVLGLDAHIAPIHPAYCEQPIPAYQPDKARALLAEAGHSDGLNVVLTTKNDHGELAIARALQALAEPGGFNIEIDLVEPAQYWDKWKVISFGLTRWIHRPLATMMLALAYSADEAGQPVAWNETHWVDEEFVALLKQAERTLDIEKRRILMCQLQTIKQERGPVAISHWRKTWRVCHEMFRNMQAHPSEYDIFYNVWRDR